MTRQKTRNVSMPAVLVLVFVGLVMSASSLFALPAGIQGKFVELKEPSTHTRGKVKLMEFADFYCPHCHMFEQAAIPVLEKEFGDRLEVTMIGFPVIPGKLPTAFDMYEQAKTMGKGEEMKRVLFRTIHKDKMHVLDKVIRQALIKEVGLDPVAFEAGLASGKPARAVEAGKAWGKRIDIQQTPTIVLDGNIKAESIDPENLRTIIRSILEADGRR
ncbi:MAG TPA: thioredoxin domain-containing protein [Nitrospiraceae bacterium]|nr:thioredoxin domain-containing protein [Nitrospiraceae bacterium]